MQDSFSTDLRNIYFSKILSSYKSQYESSEFFGGINPQLVNSRLKDSIQEMVQVCQPYDPERFELFQNLLKNINGAKELGLDHLSHSLKEKYRSFTKKRLIIGIIEAKRISLVLEDYPLKISAKEALKKRLLKIKEVYPLIRANSKYAYNLRSSIEALYNVSALTRYGSTHPQIDKILFPNFKEGSLNFSKINMNTPKGTNNKIQRVYNNILSQKLPHHINKAFQRVLSAGLNIGAQSITKFCNMSFCELSQINTDITQNVVNHTSSYFRSCNSKQLCSCKLNRNSESFSSDTLFRTSLVMLGGFALCPFTAGLGCYAAGVTGAALTGMSAKNTYDAISDNYHYEPVTSVLKNLPGLTPQEKRETLSIAENAQKRILLSSLETVIGTSAFKARFNPGISSKGYALSTRGATGKQYQTTEMVEKYVGENKGDVFGMDVLYFNKHKIKAHSVYARLGRLVDKRGVPITVKKAKYVMDETGNISIFEKHIVGKIHHSSLSNGEPVASAGYITIKNGIVTFINNWSGHYAPNQKHLNQIIRELNDREVIMWRAWVRDVNSTFKL